MRPVSKLVLKAFCIAALILLGVVLEKRLQLSTVLRADHIEVWLEATGPFAPLVFMVVMAVAVVSPMPTFPLDLLAGRVFGSVLGTLYAVTGATLGATVSFLFARWLGRDFIARFLKGHINFCQHCSDKLLTQVVFLARLVPAVSFDMVSYGAGLTKMSWSRFSLASFLGMLPLTFLYTSFGPLLSIDTATAWLGGTIAVALLLVLPWSIERYDLFSMSRFFGHSDLCDKANGETD